MDASARHKVSYVIHAMRDHRDASAHFKPVGQKNNNYALTLTARWMCTSFPCKINKNWGAERPGTARCVGLVSNSIDSRVTAESPYSQMARLQRRCVFLFVLFCLLWWLVVRTEDYKLQYMPAVWIFCMQCLSCVVPAVSSSFVVPRHDPILSLGLGLATLDYLSVLYSTFATASNRWAAHAKLWRLPNVACK